MSEKQPTSYRSAFNHPSEAVNDANEVASSISETGNSTTESMNNVGRSTNNTCVPTTDNVRRTAGAATETIDAPSSPGSGIQAVFFDVDGTLTSFTTNTIPDSALEALEILRRQGTKIVMCTGRAPTEIPVVKQNIPVEFDAYVTINGQYSYDNRGFHADYPLDVEDIQTILDYVSARPEVGLKLVEADYVYFNDLKPTIQKSWAALGDTAPELFFDDPKRALEYPTYQLTPFVSEDEETELMRLVPGCQSGRWTAAFTDIIRADGGKAKGAARLLDYWGLSAADALAIGDGGNDVDILKYAGVGVSMGNGVPAAKAAADYITDDVDHDGVWNALKHFGML